MQNGPVASLNATLKGAMEQMVCYFLCVRCHFWVPFNESISPGPLFNGICEEGTLTMVHFCLDMSVVLISPAGSFYSVCLSCRLVVYAPR